MVKTYPTLAWCRTTLRNGFVRLTAKYWRVTNAYIVGSEARGRAGAGSELTIAVVVEPKEGDKPVLTARQLSDQFHARYEAAYQLPTWQGRTVDFQFYYPNDRALSKADRIELKLK